MNKMKKKLYIGCSLTLLPADKKDTFLQMVEEVKKELSKSFEILEFKGLADLSTAHPLSPREIYDFDIKNCVMKADCMLAICDYPSIGLGYEMATAIEKRGIPVLAVAHRERTVGRIIRGIDHKNFLFVYYDSLGEIITKTIETLTK